MHSRYQKDESTNIWIPADGPPETNYSDGSDEETYLLKAFENCTDRSLFSRETPAMIRSWPSEYHLTPIRANLLRGFDFSAAEKILELGCGCGAITRFLGETGKSVTAVEQSRARAHIASMRCRDLPNVSVVCDNWQEFAPDEQFDLIALVGVLEYAAVGSLLPDPHGALLEKCRSMLRPGGVLLIAIENKLGLKYFAGHFEDHAGKAYWGIEDLENRDEAVTFGKYELQNRLSSVGFVSSTFFYPFPDYKLPRTVLSDRALELETFSASDFLARTQSRTYIGSPTLGFDERLARKPLERNGLLGDFANSFLVVAGIGPGLSLSWNWIAKQYSPRESDGRSTILTFRESDGTIEVLKELDPMSRNARLRDDTDTGGEFRHHCGLSKYVSGSLYTDRLDRILARGGTLDDVAEWAKPWVDWLDRNRVAPNQQNLPGNFVDAIPFNFIEHEEELIVIDLEWVARTTVPVCWVLIRGLAYAFVAAPRKGRLAGQGYREAVRSVTERLGLHYKESDFRAALEWEQRLQRYVFGYRPGEAAGTQLSVALGSEIIEDPHFAQERILHSLQKEAIACGRADELEAKLDRAEISAAEAVRQRILTQKAFTASLERSLKRRQALGSSLRALQTSHQDLQDENQLLRARLTSKHSRANSIRETARAALALAEAAEASHPKIASRSRLQPSKPGVSRTPVFVTEDGHNWTERELERIRTYLFRPDYYRSQLGCDLPSSVDLFEHFLTIGWKLRKNPNPLFDIEYYFRKRPDLIGARLNPLLHYVRYGVGENTRPNPLFDTQYYLRTCQDMLLDNENPLEHYIRHGLALETDPCDYFHSSYYLSQNPGIRAAGTNPLEHYLLGGWKEGIAPCPMFDGGYYLHDSGIQLEAGETPLGAYVESLAILPGGNGDPHPLFDTRYYCSRYAKSSDGRNHPLLHFLRVKPWEKVSPCPLFDVDFYWTSNPDVRHLTLHPFFHFIRYGSAELRNPHPLFDSRYYSGQLQRLGQPTPTDMLRHYFLTPVPERAGTHPLFDRKWYAKKYRHLIPEGQDPLIHFVCIGKELWLAPNRNFNALLYLRRNEDVRRAGVSPVDHYLQFGHLERRKLENE